MTPLLRYIKLQRQAQEANTGMWVMILLALIPSHWGFRVFALLLALMWFVLKLRVERQVRELEERLT
jgi:hypothetical protein